MGSQKIRVLIVDDFADTRESIAKLLYFERDIEVVGSAGDAQQGIQMAKELHPDVILMDINMPGMDGIAATEAIAATVPQCEVIMMSVQGEADFLRRSMMAGAREYLVKPFTGDELSGSIRHIFELSSDKRSRLAAAIQPLAPQPIPLLSSALQGQTVAIFSPKGGVGRSTVAANLAIGLRMLTGKRIALVDCNMLFGDIGILLNLPTGRTIADLIPNIRGLDQELLESVMAEHSSGVRVLPAPPRPELAELISGDHLRTVLGLLRPLYDYVVIDTPTSLEDSTLSVLDLSDRILLLTTLEVHALKNVKLFLEVAEALRYPPEKLMLVFNRSDSSGSIRVEDVEENLRFKASANIVSAGQLMTTAVNQGIPVVISHKESQVAKNLLDLARLLMTESDSISAGDKAAEVALSGREVRQGLSLGRLRLSSLAAPFASRKGTN